MKKKPKLNFSPHPPSEDLSSLYPAPTPLSVLSERFEKMDPHGAVACILSAKYDDNEFMNLPERIFEWKSADEGTTIKFLEKTDKINKFKNHCLEIFKKRQIPFELKDDGTIFVPRNPK